MIEVTVGTPGTADYHTLQLIRGQSVIAEPGSPFTVQEVGNDIYITTDFGLSIQWDQGTRVYVTLQTEHINKVNSYCVWFGVVRCKYGQQQTIKNQE
jgi:hypothetical protein